MGSPAKTFTKPNLSRVMKRVRADRRWSEDKADEAEVWYLRFLELSWARGGKPVYSMARSADYVWHAHMLDSKRYRAYCDKQFGDYLDHTPVTPSYASSKVLIARANSWYLARYGAIPPYASTCCQ